MQEHREGEEAEEARETEGVQHQVLTLQTLDHLHGGL